jgi:hypothetical protein
VYDTFICFMPINPPNHIGIVAVCVTDSALYPPVPPVEVWHGTFSEFDTVLRQTKVGVATAFCNIEVAFKSPDPELYLVTLVFAWVVLGMAAAPASTAAFVDATSFWYA